jgi:YD repeat-containing protein
VTSIDKQSGGFEHAALLADLDGDGRDELYVASDDHGEVRRYTWDGAGFSRETIYERMTPVGGAMKKLPGVVFTWNVMPVPVSLIPK